MLFLFTSSFRCVVTFVCVATVNVRVVVVVVSVVDDVIVGCSVAVTGVVAVSEDATVFRVDIAFAALVGGAVLTDGLDLAAISG